jgi:hypothetical protein
VGLGIYGAEAGGGGGLVSRIRVEVWLTSEGEWEMIDFSDVRFNGFDVVIGYADFRVFVDGEEVYNSLKVKKV